MKIIRIAADLEDIRTQGSLPHAYQAYVDALFTELEAALGDGEPDFCLDQHGFIVLLEAADDLRRLPGLSLDHLDQGLFSTCPEYVEEVKLHDLCLY